MNHYLTDIEQKKLLTTIKQYADEKAQRDYHICSALIHSGMRIGEFLLITVGDALAALDSDGGYLYIPPENRKCGISVNKKTGKVTKRDHSVYLTKGLRLDLIQLLELRGSYEPEHYLIAGRIDQEPMSARNMQLRVKDWAAQAGLGHLKVTPHFFRHTHAMNIIRNSTAREPLRIVKAALGHRNINTTAIYTEASREEVAAALDEIDTAPRGRITKAQLRRAHQVRITH